MTQYLKCELCGEPMTGGSMFGLWQCKRLSCEAYGRQINVKPLQTAHPYRKAKNWKRRAA